VGRGWGWGRRRGGGGGRPPPRPGCRLLGSRPRNVGPRRRTVEGRSRLALRNGPRRRTLSAAIRFCIGSAGPCDIGPIGAGPIAVWRRRWRTVWAGGRTVGCAGPIVRLAAGLRRCGRGRLAWPRNAGAWPVRAGTRIRAILRDRTATGRRQSRAGVQGWWPFTRRSGNRPGTSTRPIDHGRRLDVPHRLRIDTRLIERFRPNFYGCCCDRAALAHRIGRDHRGETPVGEPRRGTRLLVGAETTPAGTVVYCRIVDRHVVDDDRPVDVLDIARASAIGRAIALSRRQRHPADGAAAAE